MSRMSTLTNVHMLNEVFKEVAITCEYSLTVQRYSKAITVAPVGADGMRWLVTVRRESFAIHGAR